MGVKLWLWLSLDLFLGVPMGVLWLSDMLAVVLTAEFFPVDWIVLATLTPDLPRGEGVPIPGTLETTWLGWRLRGEAEGPRDRFPRSTEEFPGEAEMVPTEDEEVELDLDRGLGEGKFMEPGEFRTYFGGVGTFLMSVFLLSLGSPMSSLCSSVMGRSAYLSWGWTR